MALTYGFLILLLLVLFYNFYFRNSELNTEAISLCSVSPSGGCMNYNVHREHHDPEAAAKVLQEIVHKNEGLLAYLDKKYLDTTIHIDPDKGGRIDVIPTTELYSGVTDLPIKGPAGVEMREYLQERVKQLLDNYDPTNIYEISPNNSSGVTSYAENKKKLILCLRNKKPNKNGYYDLHDVNDLYYVTLHELAHIMNDKMNHSEESGFWPLFKFLLINATECGVYTPVDYSKKPMVYCGLALSYNPYFDARL